MKYIPRFINNLFKLFTKNTSANKIRCFYYTHFKNPYFKITYENNNFNVNFKNGISLKFYDNPFDDLYYPLKGYLKNYSVKKGNYIIDSGAYIGAITIYFAKLVGKKGRVVAFEPDEDNFKKLLNNIKINNLNNVILINKGLWNKNEKVKFDSRKDGGSIVVECKSDRIKGEVNSCEFVKLDDELEKLNVNKIDFIKMDVEGAEIEALDGCVRTLKNNNVNLAIASYHIRNGEKTYKKVEEFFYKIGYKSKTEFNKHLTTYAFKNK
jgi:FkbM family methyltransferase